eukprot:TRINITY_DN57089_c0_g1_i1.p1 TRINITY_DN57089_c0_g1~~TRINITY_DN57089_c0_g1_i1.p1  ORF type:complete len:139 (+),score=26.98 TRINITY_DN57089_c0_g1_i1:22-438(+)
MAGHGYIAMGLLSLLPGICLAAYVLLNDSFRKDMPRGEAVLCWSCVVASATFPFTLGAVGKHKRRNSILQALEAPVNVGNELLDSSWDYGFFLVQLHMLWIVVSFFFWRKMAQEYEEAALRARQVEAERLKRMKSRRN